MMTWETKPLDLRRYREEFVKQYRRYCGAVHEGHGRKIHQLENLLLRSHSGKVLALARAAQKKGYPLYGAKLEMMANMLSCWEQPSQPATLYFMEKPDGSLRWIFRYGVFRAAQQYLVRWVLAPRLRLHEGQYAIPGRDRTAAVEKAKQLIGAGYDWIIRGDVKDYYPSMNGEKALALLPGPPAVLRQVVLPPPGGLLLFPPGYALAEEVRRGLPQGAATTPMVAAAVLAPVLDELPDAVVVIIYVDDFAIFASSKAAAASAMNTLQQALWAAPVGHLELKFCDIHHVTEGFGFLGYHIFRSAGGGATACPSQAGFERLDEQLDAVDAAPFANPHAEKMARLISWRCSYAAWDGGGTADDTLIAILGNPFGGDLEELVELIRLRAQKTKEKVKPKTLL